jgi:hypothetical protein
MTDKIKIIEETAAIFLPKPGNHIAARRKIKSKIYANLIVGPVFDIAENATYVTTNRGTDMETTWTLFNDQWEFELLFIS